MNRLARYWWQFRWWVMEIRADFSPVSEEFDNIDDLLESLREDCGIMKFALLVTLKRVRESLCFR